MMWAFEHGTDPLSYVRNWRLPELQLEVEEEFPHFACA